MSHAKNKVNWCLKKAERELENDGKHRGLLKIKSSVEEAKKVISKTKIIIEE